MSNFVVNKKYKVNYRICRTFEEMLLQAAPRHEFVDKKPVLILVAVADQFDEVWMPHLPKENDFSLPMPKQTNNPYHKLIQVNVYIIF